jgi:hypothetical protein
VADKNDSLVIFRVAMGFDCYGEKADQSVRCVRLPSRRVKLGDATAGEVNAQAWRKVDQADEKRVELRHGSAKAMDKH